MAELDRIFGCRVRDRIAVDPGDESLVRCVCRCKAGCCYRDARGGDQPCQLIAEHQTPKDRSEEHTSELQSLMRISYAVFCFTKQKKKKTTISHKLITITI